MNLLRALFSVKGVGGNYGEIRRRLATDPEFQAFYSGESMKPPGYYHETIRKNLGLFYEKLPKRTLDYLQYGQPLPNPRVSNALGKLPSGKLPLPESGYQNPSTLIANA